jgi:phosphate/sulfate permease
MEYFLILVVILFALAISDLVVGVCNDAVNFLNSAIGSRVAPRHVVLIVASVGIIVGAGFSGGMMEVARKGIFHPGEFQFPDIMVLFFAVMITDVMLLDLYSTFALPTSTTVSIVFELLGAAVAVSVVNIYQSGEALSTLNNYINSGSALTIILGILLSIVVAFTVGAIVQYITRLIFTFDFEKRFKRYGAVWGGAALTAITFFIIIKGLKGSAFFSSEMTDWVLENTLLLSIYGFVGWTIVLAILQFVFKVNILKPIVLVGTFALALAFAANDLVNFIGVPLAAFSSYNLATISGDPMTMTMGQLASKVPTQSYLLVAAGVIMVVTLWLSRKSRSVTKTEVNLGRQTEGYERFESSMLSRQIVRISVAVGDIYKKIVPARTQVMINRRFDSSVIKSLPEADGEVASFDLLRATVNLMVAAVLISFATSLKLPLSTTYVTFMVAMGASLSDRAWGRDSAVYRVNGVLAVVGGWFMTAVLAFTAAAAVATTVVLLGVPAIIALVLLAGFFVYRTNVIHRRREEEEAEMELVQNLDKVDDGVEVMRAYMKDAAKLIGSIDEMLEEALDALFKEKLGRLDKIRKETKKFSKKTSKLVGAIFYSIKETVDAASIDSIRYGNAVTALQEIDENVSEFIGACHKHISNNHNKPFAAIQDDLTSVRLQLKRVIDAAILTMESDEFERFDEVTSHIKLTKKTIKKLDKSQMKRVRDGLIKTRESLLFLNLVSHVENIANHTGELASSCLSMEDDE